jgi:hypothetical protein
MNIRRFSTVTQTLAVLTATILLYGYACRLLSIYFFWESKSIGWTIFWLLIIFICRDLVIEKRRLKKSALAEKIIVGLSVFVILVKSLIFFATRQTSVYAYAINFIRSDASVKGRVGAVRDVFLMPVGSIAMQTGPDGEAGSAELHFIVKGVDRYEDLNLILDKEVSTDWKAEIAE